MHINWTKIALLQHAIKSDQRGYSCLIDADTVVIDYHFSFDGWIRQMGGRYGILMTKDTDPFNPNRPNAGLILVDHEIGGQIIDAWIYASRNEGSHLADTHPRNQLVYWNYVQPKYEYLQLTVSNSYATKFQIWKPYLKAQNRFLFHFTQSNENRRVRTMKWNYEKFGGDMTNLSFVSERLNEQQKGLITLC